MKLCVFHTLETPFHVRMLLGIVICNVMYTFPHSILVSVRLRLCFECEILFYGHIEPLNVNYDVEMLLSHAWTHGNCKSLFTEYGTEGRASAHRYNTKYILCILMSLREVMANSYQKKETRTRTLPTKTIFNVHTKWGRKQYFDHHR